MGSTHQRRRSPTSSAFQQLPPIVRTAQVWAYRAGFDRITTLPWVLSDAEFEAEALALALRSPRRYAILADWHEWPSFPELLALSAA